MTVNPIGISYPIKRGDTGYFEQLFETSETIRDSLANLILTPKKTRPGRPEYGSSLYDFLFEPVTDTAVIMDVLTEDINIWLPSIELISVEVEETEFPNSINLNVSYKIKNTPITGLLNITVSL